LVGGVNEGLTNQNKQTLLFAGEKNKGRLSNKLHGLKLLSSMKKRKEQREQLEIDYCDMDEEIVKYS